MMKLNRLFTHTFWLIMAIHFVVFLIIGIGSGDWHFVLIFLPLLAISVLAKYIFMKIKKIKKT